MSVRVMSLVWDSFSNGGSEKLVMLAMADWCDDNGASLYPSHDAVARKCCISRSQAQRVVKTLTDNGWLEVIGNQFGGAPGTTKQYRLNVSKLKDTGSTHATGSAHATGSTQDVRRVAPRTETGSTHATQSTIEPSIEPPIVKRVKRATTLPDDFCPNATGHEYAETRKLKTEIEVGSFKNHHTAKGTTFKDWQAAWRTWCDKAVEYGRAGSQKQPNNGSTRHDRIDEDFAILTGRNRKPSDDCTRVINGEAERVD